MPSELLICQKITVHPGLKMMTIHVHKRLSIVPHCKASFLWEALLYNKHVIKSSNPRFENHIPKNTVDTLSQACSNLHDKFHILNILKTGLTNVRIDLTNKSYT